MIDYLHILFFSTHLSDVIYLLLILTDILSISNSIHDIDSNLIISGIPFITSKILNNMVFNNITWFMYVIKLLIT